MKKNLFVAAILGMMLVLGTMVVGCADGTPAPEAGEVPAGTNLPANWKTLDYQGWKSWMESIGPLDDELFENNIVFLLKHLGEITAGGKQLLQELFGEGEQKNNTPGITHGCAYTKWVKYGDSYTHYLLSTPFEEALGKLNSEFGATEVPVEGTAFHLSSLVFSGANWVILGFAEGKWHLMQNINGTTSYVWW